MTRPAPFLAPLALLAAACAPQPGAIAPAPMPAGSYAAASCAAAQAERAAVAGRLAALEDGQRAAAMSDLFGVVLTGVPLASLAGGDRAGDIAADKGRLAALDARLAACPRR